MHSDNADNRNGVDWCGKRNVRPCSERAVSLQQHLERMPLRRQHGQVQPDGTNASETLEQPLDEFRPSKGTTHEHQGGIVVRVHVKKANAAAKRRCERKVVGDTSRGQPVTGEVARDHVPRRDVHLLETEPARHQHFHAVTLVAGRAAGRLPPTRSRRIPSTLLAAKQSRAISLAAAACSSGSLTIASIAAADSSSESNVSRPRPVGISLASPVCWTTTGTPSAR